MAHAIKTVAALKATVLDGFDTGTIKIGGDPAEFSRNLAAHIEYCRRHNRPVRAAAIPAASTVRRWWERAFCHYSYVYGWDGLVPKQS